MSSIINLNFLKLFKTILVMLLFQVESFILESCWRIGDAHVSCMEKERQALLDIKHAFVDDYGRLSSWDTTQNCCQWSGIQCNRQTGHVEVLDLHDDQWMDQPLRGEISPSLMELQYLIHLNLTYNDFNGSHIPEFIGSLGNLKYLALLSASFGGGIPHELGKLSNLRVLDLGGNNLVGSIPYQLGNLSSLQKLNLDRNNLASIIPSQLGNLSSLEILWLGYNDDLKIDEETNGVGIEWLSNLQSLIELDLSYVSKLNYSNNFLPIIGKLPNLRELWLQNCSLTDLNFLSVPPSLLNFSASLVTVALSQNMLTSSIFPWLFNLSSNLAKLYLPHNYLGGPIPNDFGKTMNTLEVLDLYNNELNGTVSDIHLDNLTKLQYLDLSDNSLTLKFRNNWVPPFQLQSLWLLQCKLGPGFPRWLRTQNNLQSLYISHAEINDFIPEWFWNLTRGVDTLGIESSQLKGTIPNLPLEFTEYPRISLASNQIEGSVPPFLLQGRHVDISGNQISKVFFSFDKKMGAIVENLGLLNLSSNKISERLFDCWNLFKSLVILDLSNNQLYGRIPNSLGSLSHIQELILRNNCLSGQLPSLKNFSNLELLDIGENELSGLIPPSWIRKNLMKLEILILRMNKLEGNLPLHFCYLSSVRILDLSFNKFTGTIPSCFNNLIAMAQKHVFKESLNLREVYYNQGVTVIKYFNLNPVIVWKRKELQYKDPYRLLNIIDLSNNQLVGEMPKGIENLVELVSLNLSTNNLSGKIISGIGMLKSLEVLDLSRNHFSGEIPSSLAEIYWLTTLDLSNNSLSGEIPMGTQLLTFDASCYEGNPDLCGRPLDRLCTSIDPLENGKREDLLVDNVSYFAKGFYESLGVGFASGFWIVFGSLLLIRSWRHAYFSFLNKLADCIYVKAMLLVARLHRQLSN